MRDFIIKYWLEVGFGVISAIMGLSLKFILKKLKQQVEEQKAIKAGMQALLRSQLFTLCRGHLDRGFCSIEERENLDDIYVGYHALGMNGTGTDIYQKCLALPVAPTYTTRKPHIKD